MRQIRSGVFETNSSSTHSVSVRCGKGLQQNWMPVGNDGYIHASLDEFGWEIETYRDQDAKLSYLLTMAYMKNPPSVHSWSDEYSKPDDIKRFMKTKDFKMISDAVAKYAGCKGVMLDGIDGGYIDHQSHEDYMTTQEFLDEYGVDVIEFVYGRGVYVHTDNDNH